MNAVTDDIQESADEIEQLAEQLDPLDRDIFFTRCAMNSDHKLVYTEMWFERANARDFAIYAVTQGDTLQEIHARFQLSISVKRLAFINNISDPSNPPLGLLITLKDVK